MQLILISESLRSSGLSISSKSNTDLVVSLIENGVVLSEESVTKNDRSTKSRGERKHLESKQTLRSATFLFNLNNIFRRKQFIVVTRKVENNRGILVNVVTVNGLGESLNNWFKGSSITNAETGTTVNNDGIKLDCLSTELNRSSSNNIPSIQNNRVVLEFTLVV